MSDSIAKRISDLAESAAVDACWRQWRRLTATSWLESSSPARALVDPEALVLLSLAMRARERRLQDLLLWWAGVGATLMSVQRVNTLAAAYSEDTRRDLRWFAAQAVRGGDRRFARLAAEPFDEITARSGKGPDELRLLDPATLMLRLRAGFGVGAKADLLAYLLGCSETWTTTRQIAEATSYSPVSVRRAAKEMEMSRLIRGSADRPARFAIDAAAWTRLLGLSAQPFRRRAVAVTADVPAAVTADVLVDVSVDVSGDVSGDADGDGDANAMVADAVAEATPGTMGFGSAGELPAWCYLAHVSALLAGCIQWAAQTRRNDPDPVTQASRARALVEPCHGPLTSIGVDVPDPHLFPGARYLEAFESVVIQIQEWLDTSA